MSKNPTALRVGMSGQLRGRRYTVRGWVVYSVEIDGEKYYWTEFNVADANGLGATLVFEETEDGPTWKWFTLLQPKRPLTIAEAEAKKVGDTVDYEGRQIPITLVDESSAEEIEGEPPGNVAWHEIARYFNAEAGQERLFVATWVNGKIEFYIGQTIGRRLVEDAFGLPRMKSATAAYASDSGAGTDWGSIKAALWVVGVIGFLIFKIVDENYDPSPVFASPPTLRAAPPLAMPLGIQGRLDGNLLTIAGHARTEVLARTHRFQMHEYVLRGASEADEALLLHGWGGEPSQCLRLVRVEPPPAFTGVVAAGMRRNAAVLIGDQRFTVNFIFLTRVQALEGLSPEVSPWASRELYGFVARAGDEWLVCRWSAQQLRWYRGRALPHATVLSAFEKSH